MEAFFIFRFDEYMIGYLMAMLLRGFCKISTFAHILSHTGRPFKEGWDTGSGVTLANADGNAGEFDTKIEQKKKLRNRLNHRSSVQ